ncbi:MAG: ABC transporter permease [Anaerolineae bacterium]|nr:ABC transporter permease [Anaerolineae bacterium]
MNKTILVMKHEFWRHFKRRSFLFAVLGLPVIMIAIGAGVVLFFNSKSDDPVGVIDQAGIVMDPAAYAAIENNSVPFEEFAEETAAHNALIEKEIQAYFVLPQDYLQSGHVTLYHNGDTFEEITGDISDYLRTSLLSTGDPILLERFHDNSLDIRFQALSEAGRHRSELSFILPFVVGIIFLIAVFSTSGLLLQAIVDEKENRTMEILITSLTPEELMIGKVLGLVILGFIQIGVWLGLVFIGLAIARTNIAQFPTISLSPVGLFVIVAWFVPFYILIASIIASIGISITSVSEGQQIVGITSILSMFPLYFVWLIIDSPNSTFNLVLSLIPFSAPLTILTRTQVATVPIWQMILSWLILAGTAALTLYLNSRLLRLGMLRYGKRVSWREIRQQLGGKA